jgi:uncharacterized membrane protein YhdT
LPDLRESAPARPTCDREDLYFHLQRGAIGGILEPRSIAYSRLQELSVASDPSSKDEQRPPTFWEVVGSTLAAAIGVQSKANKVRDFSRGNPVHFIVAGILFTVVFVVIVMLVVKAVLRDAI